MNKTALITGATSGIGLALANVFAKHAFDLILTARNQEDLKKTADNLEQKFGVNIKIFAADLSKNETPQDLFNFCKSQNVNLDVLINNAGFGTYGKFNESNLEQQLNV